MRVSIVIFTLCLGYVLTAELTEEQMQKLKPYKDACLAKTGITQDVIDEFEKSQMYPEDGSLNCYSACMFKKLGFLTDENEMDDEIIEAIMSQTVSEDVLSKAIMNCKNEVTKDECETAGKLIACFLKNGAGLA